MLHRLALRDFVIVPELEVEFRTGFSVLTGETGAGKSILIDALQLALGARGDADVVREGQARAEIVAEFDSPETLCEWLQEAGFQAHDGLLLRRVIDTQGKSRAWINGSSATLAQLREIAGHLVDIHGQHAWQSLTRTHSVRGLLDAYAGVNTTLLTTRWLQWKVANEDLQHARAQSAGIERDREHLVWQIGELEKLAPGVDEWESLNAEHRRLSNAHTLIEATQTALAAICEADENAEGLIDQALDALRHVAEDDLKLSAVANVLRETQAQLNDAGHSLRTYLDRCEPNPDQLRLLDERLSAWVGLARKYHRSPPELPPLLAQWREELKAFEAATDLVLLERAVDEATGGYKEEAARVSDARRRAAPLLANAVTQAIRQLGMAGGRFEVVLNVSEAPQSFGYESAEFMISGHAGTAPRPLSKVASGGELSRIALAIAVTTSQLGRLGTLIFDEIDAGVGGMVAETVGRLMKLLGQDRQVLAVTHLAQVAASADHHYMVSKSTLADTTTVTSLSKLSGEPRVTEIARMMGGERLSGTSLAHAQEMLMLATDNVNAKQGRR